MTTDQLKGITDRARRIEANKPPNLEYQVVTQDIPAMIAEIKRLTAALAERQDSATDGVVWKQSNSKTQQAFIEQKYTIPLLVEQMIFNDGSVGWWARCKNSLINAYATEAEAKSAAIAAARGCDDKT